MSREKKLKQKADDTLAILKEKGLNKHRFSYYFRKMDRAQKRKLRRIARDELMFYLKLRSMTGYYRESSPRDNAKKRKRMSRLPFSIDTEKSPAWSFVDATRGIVTKPGSLIIPSIQNIGEKFYLDIRLWASQETEAGTKVIPTKKGVCFPVVHLAELRQLLTALHVRWKRDEKKLSQNQPGNGKIEE